MKKEELLNKFREVTINFYFSKNDEATRNALIIAYDQMIKKLQADGEFMYTFIRRFVDCSTPEQINWGDVDIRIELSDGSIVTIEDYCDLRFNEERQKKLIYNVMDEVAKKVFK
jgi:hypothetical protein